MPVDDLLRGADVNVVPAVLLVDLVGEVLVAVDFEACAFKGVETSGFVGVSLAEVARGDLARALWWVGYS